MSLVPPAYRCCQPRADQAVSGQARHAAGPAPRSQAARPPDRPRVITKYGIYRSKRELTTAAIQACACRWAPDQYDSAVLRISARDDAGSSDASESI
jgi:hypothetical protein